MKNAPATAENLDKNTFVIFGSLAFPNLTLKWDAEIGSHYFTFLFVHVLSRRGAFNLFSCAHNGFPSSQVFNNENKTAVET